ncbi:MAG: PLP-dependent aminotransferase family protein [Pseudomonadota bacterium]
MTKTFAPRFADRMAAASASEIRELLKVADQPDILSFGGGIPDPALFPSAAMGGAIADILSDPAQAAKALQYSVSEGDPDLRAWIAAHMTHMGCPCTPENVLITSGAQQGLDYLGRLFINPGDAVHMPWPTYLGALQAFAPNRPRHVRLDIRANTLPEDGGRSALAYVVPDFANPTGETLDAADRQTLLDMVRARDMILIEDSPYRALRFEGQAQTPIQALDIAQCGSMEHSRVVHLGSFSKVLAPGLRVGWVCAARSIISRLVLMKQASDLNAPRLNQMAVLSVARAGLDAQVARAVDLYRTRRDAMLSALAHAMPPGVTWTTPAGGMFLWLTLPPAIDAAALLPRAMSEAQVAYVPGAAFFPDRRHGNCMRLSYSLAEPAQIAAGMTRLGTLLRREIEQQKVGMQ